MDLYDMNNKVLVVTGAASGMGRAFASLSIKLGAVGVTAVDKEKKGLDELDANFQDAKDRLMTVHLNVCDENGVIKMLQDTVKRFGRIDGCFNHAGIGSCMAETIDMPTEEFRKVIENNVLGPFYVLKHTLRIMKAQGYGAIVNTASLLSVRGMAKTLEYSTSRGAVLAMSRCAALEAAAYGVRVNSLLPGLTDTPINDETHKGLSPSNPKAAMDAISANIPIGRYATAEEQAQAALFLISDAASYVSGLDMLVDGGLSIHCM
ncbi:MAG: SDR family oxidoreductase [Synergistaceae bacterium]|jgi:NAD(P)-dependent dehydrogenase (short-subunit alcohol dehydrogenase family)|nr:SDR family oxidoreductase [Synergistaceae bacterium]